MKKAKRLLAGALATLLLLCAIPLSAVAATDHGGTLYAKEAQLLAGTGSSPASRVSTILDTLDQYTGDVDAFRDFLQDAFEDETQKINLSAYNIPATQISMSILANFIGWCMPEAFHVNPQFSASHNGVSLLSITVSYLYDLPTYRTKRAQIEAAADRLLDGIKDNPALSDVEKALLLHDRLALHCTYDNDHIATNSFPREDYTVYGSLINRVAVCQGYSLAYILLLDAVGIESHMCSSASMNHGWNIVYINNTPYHVDVTHDDSSTAQGAVSHENFLVSTSQYRRNNPMHQATDFNTAPQSTVYDNAYWRQSKTAFQLMDEKIYYIDHTTKKLYRRGSYADSLLLDLSSAKWSYTGTQYWPSSYARLAVADGDLYVSLNDGIYAYDSVANTLQKFYTPQEVTGNNSIFGFAYDNGNVITNITNTPNAFNHGNAAYNQYVTDTVALSTLKNTIKNAWYSPDNQKTWYYLGADGKAVTNWQQLEGHWYYFQPDGKMQTGWLKSGNTYYYLRSGGKMATGWEAVGGKWYYFNASGKMQTGWLKSGSTYYYLRSGGAMATGWEAVGGKWYYFNTSGLMQTGWLKLGNSWYYLYNSGAMATGWVTIGGTRYYFYPSGVWNG